MEGIERLIRVVDVCTGTYKWYWKGTDPVPCPLYEVEERRCEAVSSHRLEETFSKGGCLIVLVEFLRRATDRIVRGNRDVYAVDWEESEDIDLDKLERRLVKGNFTGSEISDWHNYMKKAADRAILLKLIARGVVIKYPKNPKCLDCKHFLRSRPHVCLLTDERKLKGDPACDAYSPWSAKRQGETSTGDEKEDAFALENKISVDVSPDQETSERLASNPEELVLTDDLYQMANGALRERARRAKTPPKRKEYWEKRLIFQNMIELTCKGYSEADAKSELLKLAEGDTKPDSRRRKLDRYWAEIEEFLEKEVFHEYRELFEWFRRQKGGKAHD